jgi:hypothetical protein
MLSNLDRYKKDLDNLIVRGERLLIAMQEECFPVEIEQALRKTLGGKTKSFLKELPGSKARPVAKSATRTGQPLTFSISLHLGQYPSAVKSPLRPRCSSQTALRYR